MRNIFTLAFLIVIISVGASVTAGSTCSIIGDHKITDGMELHFDHSVDYSLVYDSRLKFIFLTGTLQIGIVEALNRLLTDHPQARGLVLESAGGQIYQARGLVILIKKHRLDTYVVNYCYSACTLAYVAGVKRYLFEAAKLGFHSYKLDSDQMRSFIDIESEHEKDLAYFQKQIQDDVFVDKIFQRDSTEIWKPMVNELLSAGVVHEVLCESWSK